MGPPKWPKQPIYISFLDKETITCEDLSKRLVLGIADLKRSKKVCLYSFLSLELPFLASLKHLATLMRQFPLLFKVNPVNLQSKSPT